MNEEMPWVNLTQEEVDELREKKYELSEYGKEKIKGLMEKPKPSNLWGIMRKELGFSIDMCDEIVNAVEEWLPKEHDTNSYKWNECLKKIKGRLR